MIRLRQAIEAGLRHPLLGPVLLVVLGLILAFVVLHAIEHGVEGLLFSCVVAAAVVLRLASSFGPIGRGVTERQTLRGRAPPGRALRTAPAGRVSRAVAPLPLRL